MEGVLLKWVNYIFGWRERYFVLKSNVLYYYYKKGEKPKGKIHLAVSQLIQTNDPLKFEIDTGLNILYIKAFSTDIKDEWIRAIKLAKLEGENKTPGNMFNLSNGSYNKNEIDYHSNKNSMITEDKLLKKINLLSKTAEKLSNDNAGISRILNLTDHNSNELRRLLKENNVKSIYFIY